MKIKGEAWPVYVIAIAIALLGLTLLFVGGVYAFMWMNTFIFAFMGLYTSLCGAFLIIAGNYLYRWEQKQQATS